MDPKSALVAIISALAAIILFLPKLRHARSWTAIVTPLASIIGSGFMVLAPLLDRSFGTAAGPAMLGLCGVAYLFGAAIRHNITSREADTPPPALIRNLERLSSAALAIAYIISVTYYLNLFGSFGVKLTPFNSEFNARCLATAALLFIGGWGVWKGLKGLESLETWAVSLKLAIIAGLVTGLAVHFGQEARAGTLVHPPIQVTGWAAITLAFGMVITVQGFETSRYLGSEYSPAERVRSMRRAQWIATLIYVVYVGLTSFIFRTGDIETSETAVIDMSRVIAPVLPALLVAAALAAQFSAAIADTVGCGGMASDVSGDRFPESRAYLVVAVLGLVLTWTTDIFQIIAMASRAFALYYSFQCAVATAYAWTARRRGLAISFAALAVLGLAISIFGRSVE